MLDYQVPQKIILARIKVLVAKVPIVCSALDYQGGDNGQITSGCWGGGEMVSGSCSPQRIENLYPVSGFICLFRWVLLALQE